MKNRSAIFVAAASVATLVRGQAGPFSPSIPPGAQQVFLRAHPTLCVAYDKYYPSLVLATCKAGEEGQMWKFVCDDHWWHATEEGKGAKVESLAEDQPLKLIKCSEGEQYHHLWCYHADENNNVDFDITPLITPVLCVGHDGGTNPVVGSRIILKKCAATPQSELEWGFRSIPYAPSHLATTIDVSPVRVNLSWNDNSYDELGFEIMRRTLGGTWNLVKTLGIGATSYTDISVVAGEDYSYKVRAFNDFGSSSYSSVVTKSIPEIPETPVTPTGLDANVVPPNAVDLSWDASNMAYFEVWRQDQYGVWSKLATTIGTSFTDTGVVGGNTYSYKVMAFNAVGNSSGYSDVITVSLPPFTFFAFPNDIKESCVNHKAGEIILTFYSKPGQEYHHFVPPALASTIWNDIKDAGKLKITVMIVIGSYYEIDQLEVFS